MCFMTNSFLFVKKKAWHQRGRPFDIGLSKSAPIKWRTTGATPNGETLNKIAEYFSVSVSVLFGEETKKAPTPKGEREMDDLTNEILNELEGMSHAEILLVKERIQKIKESRE